MSKFAEILWDLLRIARTREALAARAEAAEDRGRQLKRKADRAKNPKRANRIMQRSYWWKDRAAVLRSRARDAR